MKFPYLKQPNLLMPQDRWLARPIIPIRVIYQDNAINITALIDSGADFCLLNAEIGRRLDIPIEEGQPLEFFGIAKLPIKVYLHSIKLQIIGIDSIIEIPIAFTESNGVGAILGQEGFFDAFKIKFEKDHNTIEIIKAKK